MSILDLRDWFNDWGTAIRSVVNVQEQIKLGLTQVKRDSTVVDTGDLVDDEDPEAADPEAVDAKATDAKAKVR